MSKPPVELKLRRAYKLIQAKQYTQARQLLANVDHPKAYEWLAKINRVAPMAQPAIKSRKSFNMRKWVFVALVLLTLSVLCYALVVAPIVSDMNDSINDICAEYDCD